MRKRGVWTVKGLLPAGGEERGGVGTVTRDLVGCGVGVIDGRTRTDGSVSTCLAESVTGDEGGTRPRTDVFTRERQRVSDRNGEDGGDWCALGRRVVVDHLP